MMRLLKRVISAEGSPALILIRLLVGAVFLSEGIQKFLFPNELGVGRFIKIGIPIPEIMAPFVGVVEIGCGALVLVGLLTRVGVIPLIIDMFVAIASTKIPILMGKGFWAMAHEARTDYSMLLGSIFLLIVGAGRWSFDARLGGDRQQ
jgi:putative oxidoreductase